MLSMKNQLLFVTFLWGLRQATSSTFVSLSKRDASDFLSSKSIEAKHSTQDKELCISNEYFCESNSALCQTEEVYERRCSDCSFFQTCDIDFSVHCLHGTRKDCIGLEPFDLGYGTLVFLLILTFICIALIITLVVLGVRKYRERKNATMVQIDQPPVGCGNQNNRVHPQVSSTQNPGLVQLHPIQPADHPPAYSDPTPEHPQKKKGSKRKAKSSSENNVQGSIQPTLSQSQQHNYQTMGLPKNTQVILMSPAQSTSKYQMEQSREPEKRENTAVLYVVDPTSPYLHIHI